MLDVQKIFYQNPAVKHEILKSNPLLSELHGFSYGIEQDFPEEYQ